MRARLLLCLSLLALYLGPVTHATAQGAEPPEGSAGPHAEVALTPVAAPDSEGEDQVLLARAELTATVNVLGVTWSGPETAEVAMRTRQDGTWSGWQALEVGASEESSGTEGDAVIDATEVEVRLTGQVPEATLTVWASPEQPLDSGALTRVDGTQVPAGASASPDQDLRPSGVNGPIIQTRAQWGADESVREWSPNHIEDPTLGVTIHHTAGTNDYTAAQVPAILRGIYHYHAITRDWGDVGYTMLVDKFGRAWEGRAGNIDLPLRTAHAYGMNYTTAGISVLGDYDKVEVPTLGFEAMAAVTAWKLDAHGLSVTDTFRHTNDYFGWTRTLPTVHAHRDVDNTACPGRFFAARMGEFRTRVGHYQSRNMTAMQRIGGADRYATAAQLAERAQPHGTDTVYLTGGHAVPDALSVGPLAAHEDAAVLLTTRSGLPRATSDQISLLAPTRVVAVGGPTRISEESLQVLRDQGMEVTRVSGATRYETAARVAEKFPTADVVYLASGEELADALGGGAAAAHAGAPLLLTATRGLPAETAAQIQRLAPREVVVLGGRGRIPAATEDELRALVDGVEVTRLAGADRYGTSARIAAHGWTTSGGALLANGHAPVDAVAGTQFAAYRGDPVLLTRRSCQPGPVAAVLHDLDTSVHYLLGGGAVLSDRVATSSC